MRSGFLQPRSDSKPSHFLTAPNSTHPFNTQSLKIPSSFFRSTCRLLRRSGVLSLSPSRALQSGIHPGIQGWVGMRVLPPQSPQPPQSSPAACSSQPLVLSPLNWQSLLLPVGSEVRLPGRTLWVEGSKTEFRLLWVGKENPFREASLVDSLIWGYSKTCRHRASPGLT